MAIVSIGDLVERAQKFEGKLEEYYAQIRDESKDNGVRLLTYYLSRHRRHLQQVMDKFEPDMIDRILKVKLKYDIDFDADKNFHLINKPPDRIKGKELLEAAVNYDMELINLYNNMLEQPLGEDARVFIEGLKRLEEKDVVMLKKMIAMDYF